MSGRFAILGTLAACSFAGGTGSIGDDSELEDAGTPETDAGVDAASVCPWGERAFFDPCGIDADEFANSDPGSHVVAGDATFNTSTGTFETGTIDGLEHRLLTLQGHAVYVWVVSDLTITGVGRLTVVGDAPLLIAARGSITVEGAIDVGSRWVVDVESPFGGSFIGGAGNTDSTLGCETLEGAGNSTGASGGAGGGFGNAGGAGGSGSGGAVDGPLGGVAFEITALTGLRGGCPGGRGGSSGFGAAAGPGLAGGGLLLSAIGQVVVPGTIEANGAAGIGQLSGRHNGGGGGGSGGLVAMQGGAIEATGYFFANGGGGGGGANGHKMETVEERDALVGENGQPSIEGAEGAEGESGQPDFDAGGDGAAGTIASASGDVGLRGGGGGGGGTGFIILYESTGSNVNNIPILASPTPVTVALEVVLLRDAASSAD